MLVKLYTLEFVDGRFHPFNWSTEEETINEYNREMKMYPAFTENTLRIVSKEFDAEYVIKKNSWFSDYAKEYAEMLK